MGNQNASFGLQRLKENNKREREQQERETKNKKKSILN